jgi:hypothetical protein
VGEFLTSLDRSPIRSPTGAMPPTPSTWWRHRSRASGFPLRSGRQAGRWPAPPGRMPS